MSKLSAGAAFRQAILDESPLQVVGAINANHALLAKRAGFKAIYLSGGGVVVSFVLLDTMRCSLSLRVCGPVVGDSIGVHSILVTRS